MIKRYGFLYCFIFTISYGVIAYLADWDEWLSTLANIASASIGIALLIPIIIEGGHVALVLASYIRRKLTERDVRKERETWQAWNKRREEFESENPGKKFSEPPPE